MKNTIIFIGVLLLIGLGVYFWMGRETVPQVTTPAIPLKALTVKDATYSIDNRPVTLKDGVFVETVPGSASTVTTRYFGNEVQADLNSDGRMDTVLLLTQNSGGSGTFYYVVASLNTVNGFVGSQALLLGDRIAPQTTEMSQNPRTPQVIVVNYADRKAGESFAVAPSVGKSIWLKFDPQTMQFGEVAQNFEGEADPSVMKLDMKKWNWIDTTYNDGKIIKPKTAKFSITFKSDKTFSASTDCNGVGGEYTVSGNKIVLKNMMGTQMYCDGSQEQDFTKMLGQIESYFFTSKGELIFNLKLDTGTIIFK